MKVPIHRIYGEGQRLENGLNYQFPGDDWTAFKLIVQIPIPIWIYPYQLYENFETGDLYVGEKTPIFRFYFRIRTQRQAKFDSSYRRTIFRFLKHKRPHKERNFLVATREQLEDFAYK